MAQTIARARRLHAVVIKGADDMIGVVTVHDGPSLPQGEIIAPIVGDDPRDPRTYHNNFQDPEAFLAAGGPRGRQLQVLVEGTYYINRLFATVEMIPKTVVEVGNVGVVVSYTGDDGRDISGDEYKHGELVDKGERGVWSEPLLARQVRVQHLRRQGHHGADDQLHPEVDAGRRSASHRFDENLSEVSLITKDAFEPIAAALGGRAHRLPQGAARHPALRRRQDAWSSRRSTRWSRRTSRTSARRAR